MIKEAIVRHAPKTGLGKTKRMSTGVVYFDGEWLGGKVVIYDRVHYLAREKYYRVMEKTYIKQIKKLLLRLKRIERVSR